MKEQLKQLIVERQKANGNSSGTSVLYLMEKLNLDYESIKPFLNELHKEGVIRIRLGVNSSLIFLKKRV